MQRASPAPTPVVPPRPSAEELKNPVPHSLKKPLESDNISQNNNDLGTQLSSNKMGVKGMIQKVNPFRSTVQVEQEESEHVEHLPENKQNPGMFKGVMQKVNPFRSSSQAQSRLSQVEQEENEHEEKLPENKQNPGMFKGVMQKVNPFRSSSQAQSRLSQVEQEENEHVEKLPENKQNPGMFKGVMQKVNPFKSSSQAQSRLSQVEQEENEHEEKLPESKQVEQEESEHIEHLPENKQNPGMFKGVMQKVNPFKSSSQAQSRLSQVEQEENEHEEKLPESKQSHGVFKGVMQKVNPFRSNSQIMTSELSASRNSLPDNGTQVVMEKEGEGGAGDQPIGQKKSTVKLRIKRFLPGALFHSAGKEAVGETELSLQESTVEIQEVEIASVLSDGDLVESEVEDPLMVWWRTVQSWTEWNESPEIQDDEELAVEQAADRVYMAAQLFVRLFNQQGGSLQQRILELLCLADAADSFHKRTVTASVGGGVASVAGSITTITGLILAPFTFGTSLIVTAVGIGVATAGGITSASANITDTVHSNTDRKKVESMIEGYQEEIKDIRECLDFLQEGMEALEQWNFEHYKETVSKRALNQNVRHVMKEGGRAGKALMINAESLVSTVQVLGLAGGAAKAAQAISVTTGVMSGLFLALDLFFLAKDSNELRKGAKTQFASKIREVCKDLQDGLLELNRIKADLQKTMEGIELEEEEEEEEEGQQQQQQEQEELASDPVKLAQLEE